MNLFCFSASLWVAAIITGKFLTNSYGAMCTYTQAQTLPLRSCLWMITDVDIKKKYCLFIPGRIDAVLQINPPFHVCFFV